jgi:hypothetical protein
MKLSDVQVIPGEMYISLAKLTGKKIADIRGYLTREFGEADILITTLVFEDGSEMGFEGEHDHPYLTQYAKWKQPNFDQETLGDLWQQDQERK